jgi:transposase-like protein
MFENSKLPLLTWIRAIHFVMQGKRGVSALELKRLLGMSSYGTAWMMLMKIRKSLGDRDATYKLEGIVELDGAYFSKVPDNIDRNEGRIKVKHSVLMAVERKDFFDERGRKKTKAGFAQVLIDPRGHETKKTAERFVRQSIKPRSILYTDGKTTYRNMPKVGTNMKIISGLKAETDAHLPWVSKFISNAKSWLIGTHHGIESKYLSYYLAEYTYRFNRRHDPDGLFDRALKACLHSSPTTQDALTG